MNKNQVLTVTDLIKLFKSEKVAHFSAHDAGGIIKIRSNEIFEISEENNDDSILNVWLKSCHINENLNKSFISENAMKNAMPSFKGKPILGSIIKNEDSGEYDFNGHDMEICEDSDGNAYINYIEQIIGTVSEIEEPYLEYDKDNDKTYVMVKGRIFDTYTRAGEIIKRRKKCSCSVELAVEEVSFDAKNDLLILDKFEFSGVTILGENVAPGMEGATISVEKFEDNNIDFSQNYSNKLLETLDKLNTTLSKFSIDNDSKQKGVEKDMDHFEELLEIYELTAEDIDFEVEGLSDEELDAAFEEHFGCKKKKKYEDDTTGEPEGGTGPDGEGEVTNPDPEPDPEPEEPEEPEEEPVAIDDEPEKKKRFSIDENGNMIVQYKLSHDDIRYGIYNLLCMETDYYAWVVSVYDDKFIYQDCEENKFYRRGYSVEDDVVSIADEKVEVFNEWLSQAEKDALDTLKNDYAQLKEFKDTYDAAEVKATKEAIFNREEYTVLAEDEAFVALKGAMDNFSADEIEAKVKAIFADYVIGKGNFSLEPDGRKKSTMGKIGINFSKPSKKKPYGNLFRD